MKSAGKCSISCCCCTFNCCFTNTFALLVQIYFFVIFFVCFFFFPSSSSTCLFCFFFLFQQNSVVANIVNVEIQMTAKMDHGVTLLLQMPLPMNVNLVTFTTKHHHPCLLLQQTVNLLYVIIR